MRLFKVIKEWDDDLIWCPSQCYLRIEHGGLNYIIYLRWRHEDPWTASVIDSDDGFNFNNFNKLDIPFYKDSELDELKLEVEVAVNKFFINRLINKCFK